VSPAALFLVLQAAGWTVAPARITVGDTVWISRTVSSSANVAVRLEPLTASKVLLPLEPPRWSYAEGTVAITYVVALFEPGAHTVSMPAVELVLPDGRTEVLPAAAVAIAVASVLPGPARGLPPKGSLGPVPREPHTWLPVVALPAGMLLLTILAARFARRRDPRPARPPLPAEEMRVPIEEWIAAGESRAVATVVALRLRQIVADTVEGIDAPLDVEGCARVLEMSDRGSPARELAGVLRALERARFSPAAPADVHEVVDDAERAIRAFQATRSEAS
jgi:hypothetical protein